ncbi:heme exporter protein D [Breoghania corrubedonensis]|uniref:Heme exporter protein D n=1 Tax=Breoghania corrubedonensis TaxID=665038 RepID=A0A2T5VIF1_9HYPH|nr:heme exporter protein CcmD [Breoghania corrubedonensis]PTW63496.1 heme exporter protein D [Breoghania corrubedonensis]
MLPDLGNHAGFIIASYAVSLVVIATLIAWIRYDYARQKSVLAELEARGLRRRSAAQPPRKGTPTGAPTGSKA